MTISISKAIEVKPNGIQKLNRASFIEVLVDSGKFATYQGGLYLKSETGIFTLVQKCNANSALRKLFTNEDNLLISSAALSEAYRTLIELPILNVELMNPPNLVRLKNGIFDIQTGKLIPPDDELLFSFALNADFVEDATLDDAPNFKRFLFETFGEDDQSVLLLRQVLAHILSNQFSFKGSFFFIGVPSAGKSVLIKLLRTVIPHTSALPLHQFDERFSLAMLKGMHANLSDEIAAAKISGWDVFKKLTSGDKVVIETKGFQPEDCILKTHLVFAGNWMPQAHDFDTLAILDRIVLLYFPHHVPPDKRNPNLIADLVMEKSVIVSWALTELPQLINSNYAFAKPVLAVEYLKRYAQDINSVEDFIKDCIALGATDDKVHTNVLWEGYKKYCNHNAINPQPLQTLKTSLSLLNGVTYGKFRVLGSPPAYGYRGLKLIPATESKEDDEQHVN